MTAVEVRVLGARGEVGHGSVAGEVLLLAAGELRLRMGRLHVSRTATLFCFFFFFVSWVGCFAGLNRGFGSVLIV